MVHWVRAVSLISLITWLSVTTTQADDSSSDTSKPLSLKERAVVIFEHSFQLTPQPVASTPPTPPAPGTTLTKPKPPKNQVVLKFILLATHNDTLDKVKSRLVIFQDLDPNPNDKSGNTSKWFWSQFNNNLHQTYVQQIAAYDFINHENVAPPRANEPELVSFPVGATPPSAQSDIFFKMFQTRALVPAVPAAPTLSSLASYVERIQVTPDLSVDETSAERKFLDALGERLQTMPNAVSNDPTPVSNRVLMLYHDKVAPTGIADVGNEVTVSYPIDLSKSPYNSDASPFVYQVGAKTAILREPINDSYKMRENLTLYGYAADWITASYTANNRTPEANAGKEFFASAPVHVLIYKEGGKRRLDFYPTYFTGTIKQATINHDFAVVPKGTNLDVDYLTIFPYLWSYLDPKMRDTDNSTAASPTSSQPVDANASKTASDKAPAVTTKAKPLYTFPLPSLPTFNYDASGASAGIDLNLIPGDPENKVVPSIEVSGGKYFDHDFYNVNTNLSWKFTPFVDTPATSSQSLTFDSKDMAGAGTATQDTLSSWKGSFGPQFARSVTPNGNSSASKTSGMAAFTIEKDVADDSYKWTQTSGILANSNNATGVSTDEYSGTTYAQQLWREHIPWGFSGSAKDYDPQETTLPADVVTMQIDLNEWTKPAEATQNSNFYTSAVSRLHVGADLPVPPCGNDTAEFIRADTFLTGGGVMGVAPDTDRFYGGNTGGQGDAGSDLPGPVIRSFGTGKLGVFPTSSKAKQAPVGALSFANLDVTLAFPIPGLAKPFLDPEEAAKLNHIFDPLSSDPAVRELDPGLANRDEINFVANYDYWFSAKPLFTMDAAWLGGPPNDRDRSLISVGGGAEFSMAVLNLDVLYEVTLHDTSARQQPLGENIIVQLTYDIHF